MRPLTGPTGVYRPDNWTVQPAACIHVCGPGWKSMWMKKRELQDYTNSLKLLFEEQTLNDCLDIVSGKQVFFGLHTPDLGLEGFHAHGKLLEGYKKLHRAKKQYWK
jgi:hypothetical protein